MRKKCLWWSFFIAILVVGPLSALGQEEKRISIGAPASAVSFFPILAAQQQGFYADEGLRVDLIVIRPSLALQALVSGDLQFVALFSAVVRAAISGVPIRALMALNKAPNFSLVVKPEIRRVEDLKGKTLGIGAPTDLTDVGVRLILERHGLNPKADAKYISVRRPPTRLAALQAGRIDATLLPLPFNKRALGLGFKELVALKDFIGTPTAGMGATTRKMKQNPESLVRTLRATIRGIRFLKEHKGAFLELLAKSGIKDRRIADLIYKDAAELYPYDGIPPESGMLEAIKLSKRTLRVSREVSVSEVADWSFARKAVQGIKGK